MSRNLTALRVLMEAMPQEWQDNMATLLYEYDEAMKDQPPLGTRVQVTDSDGKLVKTPSWITSYRHPEPEVDRILGRDTLA